MKIEMPIKAKRDAVLSLFLCGAVCVVGLHDLLFAEAIALAIGITKETAKCIASMPIIIVFPVRPSWH